MKEIIFASAVELTQAIKNKKVSAVEVVGAHIQRIEAVNPKLNAVVQLRAERALVEARQSDKAVKQGTARGPLHGLPFTVKDNFESADVICTGGTKGRASFVPLKDATVVARMQDAGAILLGKTNVPEFALAFESINLVYGRTNNPYDLSRTPGGSSGGEGAIITSGGSPIGLGSDSGGSIRQPAHFCGLAGIKPTTGRVPRTGHYPRFYGTQDPLFQVGPMARHIDDLSLVLPVISGPDGIDPAIVPMPLRNPVRVRLKSLRGAFFIDNGIKAPTPETAKAVIAAAEALSGSGMNLEEARPRAIERTHDLCLRLLMADGGDEIRRTMRDAGTTELHPYIKRYMDIASAKPISGAEFSALMAEWDEYRADMYSFFEEYDVFICPTCAFPALPHGVYRDADKYPGFSYLTAFNMTGWPAAVVRGGTSLEGLPIGVQVVAKPWREDVALAVARQIEDALGGWQRPSAFI